MNDPVEILTRLRHDCERSSLVEHQVSPRRPQQPFTAAPAPGRDGHDGLRQALLQRRSKRFFADEPVGADLLQAMVGAARSVDAGLWPGEQSDGPLEYYIAARAVRDLEPAIFAFGVGGFERIADIPPGDSLQDMVLQPEFALAPALFLVVGSLETALVAHGSHGHRLLLERSGAACEAAWLAAVERGYGGSIFAGFLPSVLKDLVRIDGFRRTQLLAVAVGRTVDVPADDAQSGPAG